MESDNFRNIELALKVINEQIAKYESGLFGAFDGANGPEAQAREQEFYNKLKEQQLELLQMLEQERDG